MKTSKRRRQRKRSRKRKTRRIWIDFKRQMKKIKSLCIRGRFIYRRCRKMIWMSIRRRKSRKWRSKLFRNKKS